MIQERDVTRRSFLKVMGGVGASFALGGFTTLACKASAELGSEGSALPHGKPLADNAVALVPNAFVRIDPDGSVTVTVSRSDMGQGVRTSLAMLVAEELDADWHKVLVVNAQGNGDLYGDQGTGGSDSVVSMNKQLREIGAGARMMLIAAAAKIWNVDPSTCKTENGKVTNPATGKSLSYGELTTVASTLAVPGNDLKLKDKAEFKIIGKPTTRIDNPDVVTGKAIYGLDVRVDGMKYAVIARAPTIGASVQTVDDAAARQVPGVVDVIKVGSGVAVIADNTWAAMKGRKALNVTWNSPNPELTSDKIHEGLKAALVAHKDMPSGAKVIEATYDLPYAAHATMEPMNAVADVKDGTCSVWAGSQTPDRARDAIAGQLGIPKGKVNMNLALLGGGFGRRLSNEYISEAVEISQKLKKPVKLLWTREDDMKHDHYRAMTLHSLKGAVDSSGNPVGWSQQWISAGGRGRGGGEFGGAEIPYEIPNSALRRGSAPSPVSNGAWRSVDPGIVTVAIESFIDELAHAAGQDPYEFRRKHMRNDRLKKVLEAAAEKGNWGKPLPSGSGRGIACFDGSGWGTVVAHVMEVTVKNGEIKVDRVVAAVECGMAVNPKGVEAQIQGGISDGLSTGLSAAITVDKGAIVQSNWDDYRWMTLDAMPKVEVIILEGNGNPTGMGEPPYPSVVPALANAVFAATGKRVRKFPIKVEELV